MAIRQVTYTVADYITTKNGAIWKSLPSRRIVFAVDERTYACDDYDLYVEFKNKKQIESLFGKSLALISPYDIIEICDIMKGTSYNTSIDPYSGKISGVYDFASKVLTIEEYNARFEELCPGDK